jgi:alpha-amylase
VGNIAALGNWSPANAVKLNPTSYPTWTGSIQLPRNTAIEWKCLKREELNVNAGIVWETGSNNALNTGTTTSTTGAF